MLLNVKVLVVLGVVTTGSINGRSDCWYSSVLGVGAHHMGVLSYVKVLNLWSCTMYTVLYICGENPQKTAISSRGQPFVVQVSPTR